MTDDNDRTTCAALAGLLRAIALLGLWGFALTCISALVEIGRASCRERV